jgi:hypothetical protein
MAARFWVTTGTTGGTGNWSDSQNWSTTSGGGAGASVPGSTDTATFDASSGAGTATVDSNVTIQALTMTGFTGTLAFGTNSISLNSTAIIFTGDTTFSVTGTPVINVTNATATATTVNVNAMTEANSISFNFTGGTYPLTIGNFSAFKNLNFVSSGTTGFGGTLLAHNSADFTIFGNLTLSSNMTQATSVLGFLFAATSGTQIVTSNGKTFDMPMAQTGVGGTTKLADAFAMGATRTFNFVNGNFDGNGQTITGALLLSASVGGVTSFKGLNTARPFTVTNSTTTFTGDNTVGAFGFTTGTLNLGGYILTALSFNSSNGNTRTLNFSTSTINVTNTAGGTLWTTATATNLTVTGTPIVNISNSGAVATTVASGTLSEANAISFNFNTGTYTLTWTGNAKNIDFTGFAGTWNAASNNTIYGNLTLSTGISFTGGSGIVTFGATSGTQIITSNTKTFEANFTVNGVGGTVQLFDDMIVGATRNTVLTSGTLDLNGKKLTTGFFISSGSNTRTIAFGAGNITCNAAGGIIWTTQIPTNLSVTGTPVVNISYSGSVATTVNSGPLTESQAISFNFTTGTYALSFLNSLSYTAKSANFTGFSGTLNGFAGSVLLYGSLTLSSSMTLTASVNALTFAATSGSYTITSNGKTLLCPVTFNGVGGTWQLADALTLGSTALLLNNGTFDGNSKTISGTQSFLMTTGSATMKGVSTTEAFGMSSGTLTQGGDNTTGSFSLTAGTLALGSFKLTCTTFSSTGANARTIAFGTGNITCNAAGGTLWTTATVTNLTVTGTPVVNISNSGAVATSVLPGALSEANSISFNFTTGTYALTFLGTVSYAAKNVDFTGFAGTWAARTVASTIYGNLTLSSAAGFSLAASSGILTFGATSGVQIITTNAKTIDEPLTVNGVGGTVQLADALIMGTTRTLTHTNGTLDLNGKTLTVGTAYTTATGTKNLTFNAGTLVCPAAGSTAFNNAVPAGFTTTAGTGTGYIRTTGATAKSFVGGGSIYNCTLSNDGAGAVNISGANTFTTIANGVQPTAFIFPSSTTTTVTNWNVSGTAGNLVTITSSAAGTAATLSKASGTVSSNYLSLKDSAATGGASWYAGANSTNVSGNSGWIFSNAPSNAAGSFFFMF